MVNSDTDAEDVTQEVLLQVVRKISEFRGDSSFATWLHRVAVNAALAHRRRQAIAQEHGLRNTLDVYGEGEPPSLTQGRFVTPDDQMMSRETTRLIESAISELPAVYRDVFVLSEVEGLPNADIAEQLGMSLAAVKSRLHRARAMLREVLAPHFEEVAV
jgi:RNA polymerase sigma-70 factor (ECF subfamily)